jgi:hypothetical protein
MFEFLQPPATKGDVRIGSDVWIGSGTTILSGVTIGNGAVIGTKAVVAKDIPPYAIVVGNPGKVVKYRFDEGTIAALERIAWWDWPLEKLDEVWPLLLSENVDEFIRLYDPK